MRKSKMMKALMVFGMSVVTATAMVGITACDNSTGGGGGHTHEYDPTWSVEGDYHWKNPVCGDTDEKGYYGKHADNNDDNRCDVCNTEMGHTYESIWTKDENGHYKAANCDHTTLKDQEGPHVDAEGDNVCDTCGYEGAVATGYTNLAEKADSTVVYKNTFFAQEGKISDEFTSFGTTAKIYSRPEKPAEATIATNYVNVGGGKAAHVTNGAINTGLVVDFGGELSNTVVEGYLEINPSKIGNDWSIVKFYKGTDCTDDSRAFAIHETDAAGTLGYSLTNKSTTYKSNEEVSLVAGQNHEVYYKFNLATGRVTVTVNGKYIVKDADLGITKLNGYEVISSNKGDRKVTVDNLITITRAANLDEYKDSIKSDIAVAESLLPESLRGSDAKTTAENAITAAESEEACDNAYTVYVADRIPAYKTYVSGKVADYATNYTTVDYNKEDYEAVAATLNEALTASDTIQKAVAAYNKFVEDIGKIDDDTHFNTVDVVITISNGTSTVGTLTTKKKSINKADLDDKLGLGENQGVEGYYLGYTAADGAYNDKIATFPWTVDGTNAELTIYAKITGFQAQTESVKPDAEGAQGSSASNKVEGTYITVGGTSNLQNTNALGTVGVNTTVTYGEGADQLSFTCGYTSRTNGEGIKITAGADNNVIVTVYVAECDSGSFKNNAVFTCVDSEGEREAPAATGTTANTAVVKITLKINAGEEATIKVAGRRVIFYQADVETTLNVFSKA